MKPIYVIFSVLVYVSRTLACSCDPDTPYTKIACQAPFVGRVKVLNEGATFDGLNYYNVRVERPGQNLYKGDKKVHTAYRTINKNNTGEPIIPCDGIPMTVGKSYLLTAAPFLHGVFYHTCSLAIEWNKVESEPEYEDLWYYLENEIPSDCSLL